MSQSMGDCRPQDHGISQGESAITKSVHATFLHSIALLVFIILLMVPVCIFRFDKIAIKYLGKIVLNQYF